MTSHPKQKPRLKPCPFCGCTHISDWRTAGGGHTVVCGQCGASSFADSEDAAKMIAIKKWNRRAKTGE